VDNDREQDQRLVVRVQQGDDSAFTLLVAKYRRRVLQLAGRIARNRSEAEDITQETFLRAYRALPYFRGEAAFYTWLYRISVNTARTVLIRRRRHYYADRIACAYVHLDTPEEALLAKQMSHCLASAVEALPLSWRTAMFMRELDGMSYRDIAVVMQCPVGTVRSRVSRARGALTRCLQLAGR
jgi:RNA polymerase sigma-70 factor (ECF subfamily)